MNRRDYSKRPRTLTMYGKTAATLLFNEVWVEQGGVCYINESMEVDMEKCAEHFAT
jgi:hypothetical protein